MDDAGLFLEATELPVYMTVWGKVIEISVDIMNIELVKCFC
jgi:hypothetical protein